MFPRINLPSSTIDWHSEITPALFDITFSDHCMSAIDSFIAKNKELNILILDPTGQLKIINKMILNGEVSERDGRIILAKLSVPNSNPKLLNLILLGYVSAVEAYLRKLIRDLVNLDPQVKQKCQEKLIKFGSTYYQQNNMIPEALLEGISFTKSETIINTFRDFLDISVQLNVNQKLKLALNNFDSLCQLRHCIVHRFSNAGVGNIIKLGIHGEKFRSCIEKPIKLDFDAIQKASKVTLNAVREINHTIWESIMKRLINHDKSPFTWDLRSDKKLFKSYVEIFFETTTMDIHSSINKIYNEVRSHVA